MNDIKKYLTLYFDGESGASGGTSGGGDAGTGTGAQGGDQGGKSGTGGDGGKTGQGKTGGEDRDEKKYSDADLDKIIEKKFAKWQKQQAAAVDEAAKLAGMTAQERAEHERDKYKSELEELRAANIRAEMEKTARGILQQGGINVPDDIVSCLVGKDAETTSATVKSFSKAFKAAVQAEVKAQLSHKSPMSGSSYSGMTREQIEKETDPIKRQAMIAANLGIYMKNR